ncbi:Methyltransferase domain-containing protein [Rhodospirillales bacterium URHD0017]|nr:Methyltransferase domain-containing protein [Rhodospirillales bacterium URHD0017]
MVKTEPRFGEVEAYERFMGRWSRAVATPFLRWLRAAANAEWLDVGCGTGILSELVLAACVPATIVGIDATPEQVGRAANRMVDSRACFAIADAQALPFDNASFDIVAAALVLNFIPDPPRALREMRRVVRPGGMVCVFVWDFEPELSPSGPLRKALRSLGIEVLPLPGTPASPLPALAALFGQAGLESVEATTIEVAVSFANFDDFWESQTTLYSPTTKIINSLGQDERKSLYAALRTTLSEQGDGEVRYSARANAIKSTCAKSGARVSG